MYTKQILFQVSTPLWDMYVVHDGVFLHRANWVDMWSDNLSFDEFSTHDHPLNRNITLWIERYFSGDFDHLPDLVYHLDGTLLSQKVLLTLAATHPGEMLSYRELAERSECPRAIRRVGSVMAENLIPLFIPCHRVVRSDGSIGQYSCGIERKKWLLEHEAKFSSQILK
jgi:methylated-DNA-[protein]-cysteine S-methyltransferase